MKNKFLLEKKTVGEILLGIATISIILGFIITPWFFVASVLLGPVGFLLLVFDDKPPS